MSSSRDAMKDPDVWARTKAAFADLVELPPFARAKRLAALGEQDPELRRRLGLLLEADAHAKDRLSRFDRIAPQTASTRSDAVSAADVSPVDPATDPFGLVGRTISSFRVHGVIGRGGMGVVYRAEDIRLGRTVALKLLLPQLSMERSARQRFRQEARAASSLDHPNIFTVYEVGESEEGQLFLAMACYPGPSLAARLDAEGTLSIDAALSLARDVLRGLATAHAAGIVHRDLKPGNLMAAADGSTKILDFGLARVRDLTVSDAGFLPGTLAYMSPEQLAGAAVDERTDLWSLGIVLYEALTGRHPFGRARDLATLYSVLHEAPPPVASLCEGVGPHMGAIVDRLLRRDPDERFDSAAEVLAALEKMEGLEPRASPIRRRYLPSRQLAAGLAAGILVAALTIVAAGVMSSGGDRAGLPSWAGGSGLPSLFLTTPEARSVAVLSFVDASPDQDQEYFSDGFAEEILNALAQMPELRVTARTSSFYFKGRNVPVEEIARQLGVSTVLEGSVQRAGDRIRVTARLIDARTGRPIWARTFERDLDDRYLVQSEIAQTVAGALQVHSTGSPTTARNPTNSLAAHEYYLRGLFHWNRRTPNDLRLAVGFFEEAIRIDPAYAHPHAGLALAYVVEFPSVASVHAGDELLARVEASAARALAIDPSMSHAHAARAYAYSWRWRWTDAEREFLRAIELGPGYSTAHQWYGEHLAKTGRAREGEAAVRRAIDLDPLSLVANNDLGLVLMINRDYPAAIAQLERTHSMDAGFPIPLYLLHRTHLAAGDLGRAAEAGRRWAELSGAVDPAEFVSIMSAIRDPALRPSAIAILEEWERRETPRWIDIMTYYVHLGEVDRAIDLLEAGIAMRLPMLASARVNPLLDPIRSEPRVQRILEAMEIL